MQNETRAIGKSHAKKEAYGTNVPGVVLVFAPKPPPPPPPKALLVWLFWPKPPPPPNPKDMLKVIAGAKCLRRMKILDGMRVSAARGQWTARPTRRDQDFALDRGSSRSRRSNWSSRPRDQKTSGRNSRGSHDRWSSFAFDVGSRSRSRGCVFFPFHLLLWDKETALIPTRKEETIPL